MPRGIPAPATTAAAASTTRSKTSPSTAPSNCSAAQFANVQPHSGANANLAAFMAMMQPGDSFISLNLASGGHLSHGMKLNTSAIFYKPTHYELDPKTEQIDFDSVRAKARELKPKMILCGYSAYPRTIDFAASSARSPMKWARC
jgi:glycine/serine hydroxymethyltransferase